MSQDAVAIKYTATDVDAQYPVVNAGEVCVLLRISADKLQQLVKDGMLPPPLVSSEPKWLRAWLPTAQELSRITDSASQRTQESVTGGASGTALPVPVSAEELARAIGVQVRTLRNYRRDRRVPLPISGRISGGRQSWDRSVVEQWLRGEHPTVAPVVMPKRGRPRKWEREH